MPSSSVTLHHRQRVAQLLCEFAAELIERGRVHDMSKYDPEEKGPLDEMQLDILANGQVPYGSPAYKERTARLAGMLEHHYANNRHHPEHYPDGIHGMTLGDIVEMFFDWKAASERGEQPTMGLAIACRSKGVAPQLEDIFENTADEYGWEV